MKNIKQLTVYFLAFILLLVGCNEKDYDFGEIVTPTNLEVAYEIIGANAENPYGDGSGTVKFSAKATNAITYKFIYNGEAVVAPSGTHTYNFSTTGTHKHTVTVEAIGTAGVSSSKSEEAEVLVLYAAPEDLLKMLVGESERVWRIKAESPAHMGVGPEAETSPVWWSASPSEKASTGMYDDRYIFKKDGSFVHITNSVNDANGTDVSGTVFGQATSLNRDYGDQGTADGGEYENYPLDDYTAKWSLSAPKGQETLTLTGKAFFGYYVGAQSFSILSRSATEMTVKCIGDDGNAWFFILTNQEPQSEKVDVAYTNLVWSDDFDTAGAPDATKWTYDVGTGENGWGNSELQYYTNRTDNVTVKNGVLKITAKKENYQGANYTSARLKTQGLYDFKYGRIDVRAKLPKGSGTWPAIWMLGANIETAGWPACGEIDIMEHTGNNEGVIHGSIHTTSSSGSTVNTKTKSVTDATSEFHIYSVNWSENQITFLIDDKIYYTYKPDTKNAENWPFDSNQFIILNIAMGGTMGGDVGADFSEAHMEIDYVKVYQ